MSALAIGSRPPEPGDADQLTLTFDAQADRTDRFGRSLAYVQVNDAAGTDVALALAARGLAEAWYPRGEPEPERYAGYAGAQDVAETSSYGLYAICDSIGR